MLYNTLVLSLFYYCSPVWDKLNRRAACIIEGRSIRAEELKSTLGWPSLQACRNYLKCVLVHKCLHGIVPSYTTESAYQFKMFSAMCYIAFFAFLRIGEITVNGSDQSNLIRLNQLSRLMKTQGQVLALQLTIYLLTGFRHVHIFYGYNTRSHDLLCPPVAKKLLNTKVASE